MLAGVLESREAGRVHCVEAPHSAHDLPGALKMLS